VGVGVSILARETKERGEDKGEKDEESGEGELKLELSEERRTTKQRGEEDEATLPRGDIEVLVGIEGRPPSETKEIGSSGEDEEGLRSKEAFLVALLTGNFCCFFLLLGFSENHG
jgi:hypothetical protein